MPVFAKGLNNTSPYRMACNSNGAVWGAVRDAAGGESVQSAGGVVPFGEWTHLALVADRDAGSLVLYVNGVAQATRSIRTNANANSDDPLYIGHYTQADAIYGPVDRKSVLEGKRGAVRVDFGGRRSINNKTRQKIDG